MFTGTWTLELEILLPVVAVRRLIIVAHTALLTHWLTFAVCQHNARLLAGWCKHNYTCTQRASVRCRACLIIDQANEVLSSDCHAGNVDAPLAAVQCMYTHVQQTANTDMMQQSCTKAHTTINASACNCRHCTLALMLRRVYAM